MISFKSQFLERECSLFNNKILSSKDKNILTAKRGLNRKAKISIKALHFL